MYAKSLQSCPTLYNPMDCSQTGLSVHGILQGSGLPCPPSGDLPDQGTEPMSLMSSALAGRFFTTSATWEAHLWPTTRKNQLPAGRWILPAVEPWDDSLLQPGSRLQPLVGPWAKGTQSSCTQLPNPRNLWENVCCFHQLNSGQHNCIPSNQS